MSILIRKAGLLDTVQDLGRVGYRSQGINPGGVTDRAAVRILNTLLGNKEAAPVIECHFPGPELEFKADAVVAIGGANFAPATDEEVLPSWTAVKLSAGSVLRFTSKKFGARAYIAVSGGGFVCDEWLGSCSTNLFAKAGGHLGKKLEAGDELGVPPIPAVDPGYALGPGMIPAYGHGLELRVTEGPEHHLLTAQSENDFFKEEFIVGRDYSRMGLRLSGAQLGMISDEELVSCAVTPGVVQLPSGGEPVVLLADCQTTGGYPRIASVISTDLSLAAQLEPGDKVRFRSVSMETALGLRRRFEKDLSFLRLGIRFKAL